MPLRAPNNDPCEARQSTVTYSALTYEPGVPVTPLASNAHAHWDSLSLKRSFMYFFEVIKKLLFSIPKCLLELNEDLVINSANLKIWTFLEILFSVRELILAYSCI